MELWLRLGAAAGRNRRSISLLDHDRVLAPVPDSESDDVLLDRLERQVGEAVKPRRAPNGELGGLYHALIARPPAIAVELDCPSKRARREEERVVRIDTTELEPGRENEKVGREAMSGLVRRDPELLLSQARLEETVELGSAQGAAAIAASVPADENERRLCDLSLVSQIKAREVEKTTELDPPYLGLLLARAHHEGEETRPLAARPANELQAGAPRRLEPSLHDFSRLGRKRRGVPDVTWPRTWNLEEKPLLGRRGSRGKCLARTAREVRAELTHFAVSRTQIV